MELLTPRPTERELLELDHQKGLRANKPTENNSPMTSTEKANLQQRQIEYQEELLSYISLDETKQ